MIPEGLSITGQGGPSPDLRPNTVRELLEVLVDAKAVA